MLSRWAVQKVEAGNTYKDLDYSPNLITVLFYIVLKLVATNITPSPRNQFDILTILPFENHAYARNLQIS